MCRRGIGWVPEFSMSKKGYFKIASWMLEQWFLEPESRCAYWDLTRGIHSRLLHKIDSIPEARTSVLHYINLGSRPILCHSVDLKQINLSCDQFVFPREERPLNHSPARWTGTMVYGMFSGGIAALEVELKLPRGTSPTTYAGAFGLVPGPPWLSGAGAFGVDYVLFVAASHVKQKSREL